jgi:hypothetical protein
MANQTINDRAKQLYYLSVDLKALETVRDQLKGFIATPVIRNLARDKVENNLEYRLAASLAMQLEAKIQFIRWCGDFSDNAYLRFKNFILDNIDKAESPDMPTLTEGTDENGAPIIKKETRQYAKCLRVLASLRDYADELQPIINSAAAAIDSITVDNVRATKDVSRIERAVEQIAESIDQLGQLSCLAFSEEGMVAPDAVALAKKSVGETLEYARKLLREAEEGNTSELLAGVLVPFSKLETYSAASYYDSRFTRPDIAKGTVVLATPFEDEAIFHLRRLGEVIGKKFSRIDASVLGALDAAVVLKLFRTHALSGNCLFVVNVAECRAESFKTVAEGIIRFGLESSGCIFVHDKKGDHKLYEQLEDVTAELGLPTVSLSHEFLRMPNCQGTLSMLVDHGVIENTDEDYTRVKTKLPFMGYIGLNMLLSGESFGMAEGHSRRNTAAAISYIKRIIAQSQFIDSGWGDYSADIRLSNTGERISFDYDGFRELDKNNLKRIIEKPGISLFAKCGIAVRYCMTAGDSDYVLERLSHEELTERLTLASVVVCRLLNTQYSPTCEVFTSEQWKDMYKEDKTYGPNTLGVCIKAGKLLHYNGGKLRNLEQSIDTVCHECFHAFQNTLLDKSFSDWHFIELGITASRVEEWSKNDAVYITSSTSYNAYRFQVFESDAFGFSAECLRGMAQNWHSIEFVTADA